MATWQASNLMSVAEKYEITEDRYIEEKGNSEKSHLYDPWQFRELPSELAVIQPGDDAGVLAFVRRRGLPGSALDRSTRLLSADPPDMIEKHAAITRVALELITLVHRRDSGAVDYYLSTVWPEVERYVSSALLHDQEVELRAALGKAGLRAASEVLAALINPRITDGVGPVFQPTDQGVPRRGNKATHLLQVIYCHIADAWDRKTGYYQCANRHCDRWWPTEGQTRGPKPKYCPSGSGESLCSRQERYYRSLARKENVLKSEKEGDTDGEAQG